jgi:hypothetical protein
LRPAALFSSGLPSLRRRGSIAAISRRSGPLPNTPYFRVDRPDSPMADPEKSGAQVCGRRPFFRQGCHRAVGAVRLPRFAVGAGLFQIPPIFAWIGPIPLWPTLKNRARSLAAGFCGQGICVTMARGVLGACARRKWAQEPAAPSLQKTRRENCAAREGSTHSTNALRLKHATCPRVRSTKSSSHAVFWFAMDRSRGASSVSSELCFATFPY